MGSLYNNSLPRFFPNDDFITDIPDLTLVLYIMINHLQFLFFRIMFDQLPETVMWIELDPIIKCTVEFMSLLRGIQ
jgi:hypothetical protein